MKRAASSFPFENLKTGKSQPLFYLVQRLRNGSNRLRSARGPLFSPVPVVDSFADATNGRMEPHSEEDLQATPRVGPGPGARRLVSATRQWRRNISGW